MIGILDKYDESIKLTYNYAYRMLVHLKNITDNFSNIKNPDDITMEVYRDSIVKKYETLEDLTWKLLSKIFKSSGLEINNPRGCYKQAFKEGLINNIEIWNDILLSRNSKSHIYDEQDYEEIKNKIISDYTGAIEDLLSNLSKVVM
ncbi:HI0074 family nucleotidyltransferase substrate-binding subunit [Clostridium estertheticum]|uniref:HI0074 family nucleotidyltransferase substrate-binding subunit n=1 Tax=Clostridium estertheticum TaxID=238834 RepID=UPI001C0C8066|nr:HI0074 family nucleotidyltransferase substrate-binding subunit [Clostridium estertheticum]MBU3072515.1 nucleotidyltransferase substrate binding protein [Clostridium estertheticum]MBU3162608.1 nucleotidyltransferase substrate binding protein [Clostridium estertheticum]